MMSPVRGEGKQASVPHSPGEVDALSVKVTETPDPLLKKSADPISSGQAEQADLSRMERENPAPQSRKGPSGPERNCAVSRESHPREHLLRFVVDPGGRVVEDLTGRLPGRGAYVVPTQERIGVLLGKRSPLGRLAGSGRHQGQKLTYPDPAELLERLGPALTRRFMEGLGLARRAGNLRMGLREVEEYLSRNEAALLLLAGDTADNTREKFGRVMARNQVKEMFELLDRAHFGSALGRGATAVLGVVGKGAIRRTRADVFRWRAFHMD
ncbi:MAG: DUF448 domain-containing protein [Magnetococcales bacterium]|nr:DUF448 domain-containing protein [Magnetococcales bacterium]